MTGRMRLTACWGLAMSRFYLDTNALIDLYIARAPGRHEAMLQLVEGCRGGRGELLVGANSVLDASYVIEDGRQFREVIPERRLRQQLASNLRRIAFHYLTICPIDERVLRAAHHNKTEPDFDDALVAECAREAGADIIVSSDQRAFRNSAVPGATPEECAACVRG